MQHRLGSDQTRQDTTMNIMVESQKSEPKNQMLSQQLIDQLKRGIAPQDEQMQIKQVEAVIEHERKTDSTHYPFRFENGIQIATPCDEVDATNHQQKLPGSSSGQLTAVEIITAELRMREERKELDNATSPLLLQLTSLYKVCIFDP